MKKKTAPRAWYRVTPPQASAGDQARAEIYIYDVIVDYAWDEDETTAKGFIDDLKALGEKTPIDLHINSPGGSVFAGIAIHNAIKRHAGEVRVFIDGLAASIASVVALAGDAVIMPENALFMIHDPASGAWGTAEDMRKAAEVLDKAKMAIAAVYIEATGLDPETIDRLMSEETWMTAAEAFDYRFITEIAAPLELAALDTSLKNFDLSRYRKPPIRTPRNQPHPQTGEQIMDLEKLKTEHPDLYNQVFALGREAAQGANADEIRAAALEEGRKLGAEAERERIQAVEAQALPGHEELIATLKYDGKTTGPEAALQILNAEKALRAKSRQDLLGDQTPPVATGVTEPDANQARQAVTSAIRKGFAARRTRA